MAQTDRLFQAALGLTEPWQVMRTDFDATARRLDLTGCCRGHCERSAVGDIADRRWVSGRGGLLPPRRGRLDLPRSFLAGTEFTL